MNAKLLSRQECAALRGLAIMGIVLHNYCHWLSLAVKENEYAFHWDNVQGLWGAVMAPSTNLPIHLLSFFGHYGVPVFLFLSAFGLVMKYEEGPRVGALRFTEYHYLKLFKMMIVGFVAFLLLDSLMKAPHHYEEIDFPAHVLMFVNLMTDPDSRIWPGPYWFFGLLLQFYIVYRFVLYRRHWGLTVALILLCCGLQMFCEPESDLLVRLRYNFVGSMLPFGLGLLYARYCRWEPTRRSLWAVMLLSAAAVFGFSFNYQLWFWVPVFVITFSVSLVKLLPDKVNAILAWVGGISAALFVCHPLTRKVLIRISREGYTYSGLLVYIVASIALAVVFRWIYQHLPSAHIDKLRSK